MQARQTKSGYLYSTFGTEITLPCRCAQQPLYNLSVLLVPSNDGVNIRMAVLFATVCMAAIFKLS